MQCNNKESSYLRKKKITSTEIREQRLLHSFHLREKIVCSNKTQLHCFLYQQLFQRNLVFSCISLYIFWNKTLDVLYASFFYIVWLSSGLFIYFKAHSRPCNYFLSKFLDEDSRVNFRTMTQILFLQNFLCFQHVFLLFYFPFLLFLFFE